ncbi:PD-(D/E)XK nuclease family protein [Pseudomonas entomophila]|uniref:PDDEXK-like family protein n=1 Tax=Pseudomonas entomophila TaxID=312306 RepID=UPI0023D89906|nr:PD-(D/E)XK nuclease family protein [Pseudomonas entomophila]MDF0732385.1 PD-(D/E)XK nuclease family protein [Pseudomonas entomophila]
MPTPLIHQAARLRAEHHRPPGFNLFTLLRSGTDEVRLHSRYVAFLLDPRGAHGAGAKPLLWLLERLGIEGFDCRQATVALEYRNIDILVRNPQRQALIIENKIHAKDQDSQLLRYTQTLRAEGYQDITTLYLTLDGRDADEHSASGIDYLRVGYAADILPWLEHCQPWVIREAAVRESLLQYIDLIRKLTRTDQGGIYMDMLKQTLRKDNNLLLVKDLQRAYTETLKDLQLALWQDVVRAVKHKYEDLPAPDNYATTEAIERYYSNATQNRYYGLYYDLGTLNSSVYLELNHRFYCGLYCDMQAHPHDHARLRELTDVLEKNGLSNNGQLWRYTTGLNMKDPTEEDLLTLLDDPRRAQAAERMADDLYQLWRQVHTLVDRAAAGH